MRSYLIDELDAADMAKIKAALDAKGLRGSMEDIYYLPVPENQLSPEQREHAGACGPYILIAETGEDFIKLELLVRGRGKLRCSCIAYASPETRRCAQEFLDKIIRGLDICV